MNPRTVIDVVREMTDEASVDLKRARRGGAFNDVFAGDYPKFDLVVFTDEKIRHHRVNRCSSTSSVMVSLRALFLKALETELLLRPLTEADQWFGRH